MISAVAELQNTVRQVACRNFRLSGTHELRSEQPREDK